MVAAVVGSRNLEHKISEEHIGTDFTQIISGGAEGIDRLARKYAEQHNIEFLEILPQYGLYGKIAPLKRNDTIISLSDIVFVFWDGKSRGSQYVIKSCLEAGKPMKLFKFENDCYTLVEEVPYLSEFPDFEFRKFVPTIIYE